MTTPIELTANDAEIFDKLDTTKSVKTWSFINGKAVHTGFMFYGNALLYHVTLDTMDKMKLCVV